MASVSVFTRARLLLSRPPPILKASLTSGCIMLLGDIAAQQITTPKGHQRRLDWQRTLRFGLVGATLHGPYFFTGMRALDQRLGPSKSLPNVLLKTASSQALLFPPFVAMLFGWIGVLEGKSLSQCLQKIEDNYRPAFLAGCVFWPAANLINFRYISSHQRLLYVSCAGLLWNTFISWTNAKKSKTVLHE